MIELCCYFPVDWLHIYSMRLQAKRMLVTFLWSLVVIGQAVAYHSGPPYTACSGMAPDSSAHGAQAQVGSAPYTLTFSKNTYAPNDQITVTLSGNSDSDTFRGFFIQPRTSVNTYSTVGTISSYPPNSRNPCENEPESQRTAISHNNKTDKDSVTFTWTAPATDSGPVIFVYTVVKVKVTYWVKLQADPITFETATSNQPASSSNEPTSTLTSTQPTTPLPNKVINWDPACGTKKGCYPGPAQCSFNCDYLVKWMPVGDSDVQFTLQRKAVGDKWIAVGFSADVGMGNDSVVECASVGGQVVVRSSYNEPSPTRANNILDTMSYGIGDAQTSHIEGVMSCTFTRKISAEIVMGRRKRATTDATRFFNLNTEWYLLVAQGDMAGTTKLPHSERPKVSSEKIDFLSVGGSGVTQRPLVAGEITKGTDCGKTEGCFHDCDSSGKQCTFYVSWKENGNDIDMMIQSKQTVYRYSALGLSSDQNMGDDSVIECVADGNSVTVYVSHNVGKTNERLSPGIFGISKVVGSIKDGVATCSFSRKKTAALAGRRKRAAAGQSNYFSMDDDWYLLFATGPSSGGNIFQHDKRPVMSSQKADFQLFQDLGAQAAAKTLVKVHGILMVLAWMMLASIGIVCPRFYKSAWPDETSLFGQKIWFQIHRACMVLAFLACAVSFIIIFVHVGGYAEIVGSNFEKAHPILGIVVTALAVINPIMAIFRPHPGTPKRPIFNVAHLLVGSGAHVIGIVNLFAGVLLASAAVEEYVLIVLYVFVGWQFLFEVILYIHQQCFVNKKGFKADMYELKGSEPGSTEGLTKKGGKRDSFKIVALYIHILVIIGLSVAVCVIIGISNHDHEDGEDH